MGSMQPPPLRQELIVGGKLSSAWEAWFNNISIQYSGSTVGTSGYLVNDSGITRARTFTSTGSSITLTNPSGTAGNTNLEVSDAFLYGSISGTTGKVTVTDDGDGTITLSISDLYLPSSIYGTTNEIAVSDNGDGTVTISIPDAYIPSSIYGTTDEITVTDDGDGSVTISISDSYINSSISGTANEITVDDDGDGTVTISIPDPAIIDDLELTKDLTLSKTTSSSRLGVIRKGTDNFIHDFNYGDNGTVITNGFNCFIGTNCGNFTMGSTATSIYHASYLTAVGYESLHSNTIGKDNTAIGYKALYKNTEGNGNISISSKSLYSNTTGGYNTAIGYRALYSNTEGNGNFAIGTRSLYLNITGGYNLGIGYKSLYNNTEGNGNIAIGSQSLYSNTTGGYNTAIGGDAGRYISDGFTANDTCDKSVFIGKNTYPLANNETNQIVIGYAAIGAGSNSVTLGNSNITKTLLRGNVELDSGGMQLTTTSARPTAGPDYRGMMWVTRGDAGVADTVEICLKSASDTYSWVNIATG